MNSNTTETSITEVPREDQQSFPLVVAMALDIHTNLKCISGDSDSDFDDVWFCGSEKEEKVSIIEW